MFEPESNGAWAIGCTNEVLLIAGVVVLGVLVLDVVARAFARASARGLEVLVGVTEGVVVTLAGLTGVVAAGGVVTVGETVTFRPVVAVDPVPLLLLVVPVAAWFPFERIAAPFLVVGPL